MQLGLREQHYHGNLSGITHILYHSASSKEKPNSGTAFLAYPCKWIWHESICSLFLYISLSLSPPDGQTLILVLQVYGNTFSFIKMPVTINFSFFANECERKASNLFPADWQAHGIVCRPQRNPLECYHQKQFVSRVPIVKYSEQKYGEQDNCFFNKRAKEDSKALCAYFYGRCERKNIKTPSYTSDESGQQVTMYYRDKLTMNMPDATREWLASLSATSSSTQLPGPRPRQASPPPAILQLLSGCLLPFTG